MVLCSKRGEIILPLVVLIDMTDVYMSLTIPSSRLLSQLLAVWNLPLTPGHGREEIQPPIQPSALRALRTRSYQPTSKAHHITSLTLLLLRPLHLSMRSPLLRNAKPWMVMSRSPTSKVSGYLMAKTTATRMISCQHLCHCHPQQRR